MARSTVSTSVLGIHLWAPLQVGQVGVKDGPIFGSADEFGITVRGRGGHGGMPHTSIDPVVAAAHVVLALQSIVSRETSPFSPAVVTVGRVEGGSAFNVIADEVRLRGTVRAIDADERERLLRRVAEVAAAIASASGARREFERAAGCPPVISDPGSVEIVRRAATATVGADNVVTPQAITVGDDVACLINAAGRDATSWSAPGTSPATRWRRTTVPTSTSTSAACRSGWAHWSAPRSRSCDE